MTIDMPEPLDGCEGSMIRHSSNGLLYYSGVTSRDTFLRFNLTLFCSTDNGTSWHKLWTIDPRPTAYSALVEMPSGDLGLFYEWAPAPPQPIFAPLETDFMLIPNPSTRCLAAAAATAHT